MKTAIDGFTIILSKTNNYLNGPGASLGYLNIMDSLVLEVDLNQNFELGDSGANTLSLRRCFGATCKPFELSDSIQRSIPFVINL
jgi:hypothetical protein